MNPLSLRLRNCATWRDIELDLPEGILALTGANGAGKSTLVTAIEVALFGPEGRSLEPWYPRGMNGAGDPLQIELVFEHGGHTYRVRRSYSPKGRGTSKTDLDQRRTDHAFTRHSQGMNFCVCGLTIAEHDWNPLTVESQRSTQEMLEDLIGITRDTFRASAFVAQGEAGRFCEATPRARKQILADALGLQQWDEWLDRARKAKREVEGEINRIAGVLEQADLELSDRPDITLARVQAVANAATCEAQLAEAAGAVEAARDALAEVSRRADRRSAAETALQRATLAVGGHRLQIDERVEEIEALARRLAARADLEAVVATLPELRAELQTQGLVASQWQERQTLAAERARLMPESVRLYEYAERLQARAAQVLDDPGEICDRCGQELHADAAVRAAKSYRDEAAAAESQQSEIVGRLTDIEAALTRLPEQPPDQQRIDMLDLAIANAQVAQTKLAALGEVAARRDSAADELNRMRAGLPDLEQAVAAARGELAALGPHDPDWQEHLTRALAAATDAEQAFRRELDSLKAQVARCDERLERLASIAERADQMRRQQETLAADLDVLAALERACGPNGVPALILETVAIPQLETEANRILALLGGPAYAVELRTQKETKTAGVADTLEIVLLTADGAAGYDTFSGGERARVAFALRLALAQLLAGRRGADTGLLVIDEIDGLDREGMAALVGVLEGLRDRVPRIVVVSHQPELRDAFPQALALENVDGESRIAAVEE